MNDATAITTFPAGYTADTHRGEKGIWTSRTQSGTHRLVFMTIALAHWSNPPLLKRDNDGNVVWDTDALDNDHGVFRPIPDTEQPDDMSEHHTHFNTTTNKWEIPDETNRVREGIEQRHDNDVGSAIQNHEQWRVLEQLMKVQYPERTNPAHQAKLTEFYNTWDEASGKDACVMLADAWRKSLGKVIHSEPHPQLAETALANAALFCDNIPANTLRLVYVEEFIKRLEADAGKKRDRNYPRGVILVKVLSAPANKLERTVGSVVNTIRSALAEG